MQLFEDVTLVGCDDQDNSWHCSQVLFLSWTPSNIIDQMLLQFDFLIKYVVTFETFSMTFCYMNLHTKFVTFYHPTYFTFIIIRFEFIYYCICIFLLIWFFNEISYSALVFQEIIILIKNHSSIIKGFIYHYLCECLFLKSLYIVVFHIY